MMKSPLRILHLEDDANDASLVQAALEAAGIPNEITCVEGRHDFVSALERGGFDLILSDYTLPSFDGLSAIAAVRAGWPDLPVILVSGSLGEERAVESLKRLLPDYVVMKHLFRWEPAIRRAMVASHERAERRRLQAHFIEAQKMDVIGQFFSGVAHDLLYILAVII